MLELHTLNLNAELRRSEAQLRCILVRGDNLSLLRPASASIHRRRGLGIRRSATCVILWPLSKMLLRLTRGGTHGHNTHTRHHCPRGRPPAEARESAGRPQRCLGHADQWIRGPTKVPTVPHTPAVAVNDPELKAKARTSTQHRQTRERFIPSLLVPSGIGYAK